MLEHWDGLSAPRRQGDGGPSWLACELRELATAFRRRFPFGRWLARRRLTRLPPLTTTGGLVPGQRVRLRGTIRFAVAGAPGHTSVELVRTVAEGGDWPDFGLQLADGSSVSIAAAEAWRAGRLHVFDLWEDRASHDTCDPDTPALFRLSRFRAERPADICGVAVRVLDPHQPATGYRAVAVGWQLVASGQSLALRLADPGPE